MEEVQVQRGLMIVSKGHNILRCNNLQGKIWTKAPV